MMASVTEEQDTLCRVLGDCIVGESLDREIGDLKGSGMGKFTYLRYEHEFEAEELAISRGPAGELEAALFRENDSGEEGKVRQVMLVYQSDEDVLDSNFTFEGEADDFVNSMHLISMIQKSIAIDFY